MECVDLTIFLWVVGRVRMPVSMDREPLGQHGRRLVVLFQPSGHVRHCGQHRFGVRSVEEQERLGLDLNASPSERSRVAELRAIPVWVITSEQCSKLMWAKR